MNKSVESLSTNKVVMFVRLANLLEQASEVMWEISQGVSDEMLSSDTPLDQLLEPDSGLADTMALMLNDDARTTIIKSLSEAQRGKTRPAREFFNEL